MYMWLDFEMHLHKFSLRQHFLTHTKEFLKKYQSLFSWYLCLIRSVVDKANHCLKYQNQIIILIHQIALFFLYSQWY